MAGQHRHAATGKPRGPLGQEPRSHCQTFPQWSLLGTVQLTSHTLEGSPLGPSCTVRVPLGAPREHLWGRPSGTTQGPTPGPTLEGLLWTSSREGREGHGLRSGSAPLKPRPRRLLALRTLASHLWNQGGPCLPLWSSVVAGKVGARGRRRCGGRRMCGAGEG